jgi:NADPH-dependent 2,4-dienoyl-CoA reductase/sulfur reductase-like enzyme
MQRRQALQGLLWPAMAALTGMAGCASVGAHARPRVVVVGGGYAGATCARYLRLWGGAALDVTLVEPQAQLVSCPLSNLVLSGVQQISDVSFGYQNLSAKHGVTQVRERAVALDPAARRVRLASGAALAYDKLVLAPGVDMIWDQWPTMQGEAAQQQVLHAWHAGPQTVALRAQLQAMPDGGVFVISIPLLPFRCPPAPYERACQVAWYFKQAKPKAKIIILDANDDIAAKGALFKQAFASLYPGMIDYRPGFVVGEVDPVSRTVVSEFGDKVQADVLNLIPPQRAGAIAHRAGLSNINGRWCEVDFLNYGSTVAPDIHILGDAISVAPLMPKSGHMANQQAKVCAAAIIDALAGRPINMQPVLSNTCYSFVAPDSVMHVASVHQYDAAHRTMHSVPGAGGLSRVANREEVPFAWHWARSIWADILG